MLADAKENGQGMRVGVTLTGAGHEGASRAFSGADSRLPAAGTGTLTRDTVGLIDRPQQGTFRVEARVLRREIPMRRE
jgi:hypothetical protein